MAFLSVQIRTKEKIVRDPSQSGNTAMSRIESAFDRSQSERSTFSDLKRELACFLLQLVVRNYLVNQPNFERLAGRDLGIAEPHLLGLLLSDQVLKIPCAISRIE